MDLKAAFPGPTDPLTRSSLSGTGAAPSGGIAPTARNGGNMAPVLKTFRTPRANLTKCSSHS